MSFFGRKQELAVVSKELRRDSYSGFLIYGRRHVGKSTFVREALKSFPGIVVDFQCTKDGDKGNLSSLYLAFEEAKGESPLPVEFQTIEALLSYIVGHLEGKPLALVIDEYPYWRETSSLDLDSNLQKAIDKILAPAKAKVFLTGSNVTMMEELLKESNPLAGRLPIALPIKPFDYFDASFFYPSYSPKDKLLAYAAFGGLPFFLERVDPSLDVEQNIQELYFSPLGSLRTLVPLVIGEDLKGNAVRERIFSCIGKSKKNKGLKDLAAELQEAYTKEWVRSNLQNLVESQLVREMIPIDAKSKDKAYYEIADPSFAFYFAFVQNQEGAIALGNSALPYRRIRDEFLNEFAPTVFEQEAKDFLLRKNLAEEIDPPFLELGTYFYNIESLKKNGQFDVVGKDERGYSFYECKFRALMKKDEEEEKRQTAEIPSFLIHPYRLGYIGLEKGELQGKESVYGAEDFFAPSLNVR